MNLVKEFKEIYKLRKLRKYINERIKEYNNAVFEERVKLNYYSYRKLLKDIKAIIGD